MSESETQRPFVSRDLPESLAITIVPPKGAKGTSASERGYRKGGFSRHRSALSCLQAGGGALCCREHGHHYCAPQGGEGNERQREWVKIRAAIAATALPDCLWAEGRTLLPSRWGSKTIIIIIACDNKKIIIGLRTPLSGRHFWDAPRGAARVALEALGEDQPTVGRQLSPKDSSAGWGRGIFGMPQGGSTGSAGVNEVAAPTAGRKRHLIDSSAGWGRGDTLWKWNPNFCRSVRARVAREFCRSVRARGAREFCRSV